MRTRIILTLAILATTGGCSLNLPEPPSNDPFIIDRPPQEVWDAALDAFAMAGIFPETVETNSYFLTSTRVPLGSSDVVCKHLGELGWLTVERNDALARMSVRLRPQPNGNGTLVIMTIDAYHPHRYIECQERPSVYRVIRQILDPGYEAYRRTSGS